ncbi:MAG: Peptide transporter ATP-binding protein [Chloroflexi bacterium]|nr:Peptide transporter ATP-binding protein [Chloroflexota bacterium]
MSATDTLLEVKDLAVRFAVEAGAVHAVSDVSFSLRRGQTLGLVGESGCGKSTAAFALMGLLPRNGRVTAGRVEFEGRDLLKLRPRELQALRGDRISMVFQNPMTSLDPAYTVGAQIVDVLREHRRLAAGAAKARAIELLRRVGIPSPDQRFHSYPHQLSGGQRQRVVIAIALACEPALLIADEPTTALDVTIQAQILSLLRDLCAEEGTAIILISHDLGVIAQMCNRVAVMYGGRLVEEGPVDRIFARPLHPYTQALLRSIPSAGVGRGSLAVIEGGVPNLVQPPPGCPFAPRCAHRMAICAERMPVRTAPEPDHQVACYLYEETA